MVANRAVMESIYRIPDLQSKIPKIEPVETGIEGLDELFYTIKERESEPITVPLGGIPRYCVMNVTGVPDTGKSLLVEQFALHRASLDEKVIFISVETPAEFVAAALKQRAKATGVPDDKLDQNIIIVDAASHAALREDHISLLDTIAHVIRTYKTKTVVIDSLTGLYEHREMQARAIIRPIYNFLKKWYQTALLVTQKRSSHEEFSAESAGGYAVSHIVDGTMVLFKETIDSTYKQRMYSLPIGETVRLFRIDGCRMCAHDTSTHLMEIKPNGTIAIGLPLQKLTGGEKK